MSFSRYAIEKKQVSLDMGVTWQDATPSETRNGRLLGTYRTLIECEDKDCNLQKWGIQLVDEKIPTSVCTHTAGIIMTDGSTVYNTYLPSGIAKSVTFVSGMTCCIDTWGSSDNIIKDEYHNSSMTAKTATITTGWNPIRAYNSYVLDGREMTSGSFCDEPTCYNITEFMPWIDPNGTIKKAYKIRYVKEHCSDEWKIDDKYTPTLMTFGERWVKTYEDIYKTTWQHQIATDVVSDSGDLGWKLVWENEGEPFDYEYEVTVPQNVQVIEYLRADGIAANASGWTDFYQMKVKIDPTNLGNPRGYLAHKEEGSLDGPYRYWSWYKGETSYYVAVNGIGPLIEITPNEWKSINIDVVDRAKYAGFFCQVYVRDSSPIVNGNILNKAYIGGLIQIDGNMYFPYKVPSSNGWEDEYLNASEYGFIGRTGNKVVLEYVYGKYTNTDGVTQNLKGNGSNKLSVPSNAVDVVFADSVTSLPRGLCSGNTVITSVTMSNVISIVDHAFDGCTALKSIDIPSTVTEIGDSAFRGCTSLTGITFGSGLTNLTIRMFSGCTSLTDVVIPSNITNIDIDAFADCNSLTSLTLGEGVSRINPSAFLGCNIKYLTIRTAKPPILYKKDEDKVGSVFTFADDAVIFVPCEAVGTYKNSINWQSASSMIHPIPNEYRWVDDGYTCIDGMKYLREKKQGRNTACGDDAWYDVGETRLSGGVIKCGYEETAYIYRDSSHKGFIPDLGVTLKDDTKIEIKLKPTNNGGGMIIGEVNPPNDDDDYRFFWYNNRIFYDYGSDRKYSTLVLNNDYVLEVGNYYVKNLTTGSYILQGDAKSGVATAHTRTLGLFREENDYAWIYYIKVYEGDTLVKNFVPVKLEDGSAVTLYDKVSKTHCTVSNGTFGAPS